MTGLGFYLDLPYVCVCVCVCVWKACTSGTSIVEFVILRIQARW